MSYKCTITVQTKTGKTEQYQVDFNTTTPASMQVERFLTKQYGRSRMLIQNVRYHQTEEENEREVRPAK